MCGKIFQRWAISKVLLICCRLSNISKVLATDCMFCLGKNYCDKPDLKNGKFIPEKETYNNEEEIEYVCHKPYDSIPAGSVTCQNGQWRNTFCGPPPQVRYADVVGFQKNTYRHGDNVEFQCQNLYTLVGSKFFLVCFRGLFHVFTSSFLEPCTVTLEDMNERNLILRHTYMKKLYAKHRQPIEFFCKYGTRKANDIPFRQYCDDGKMILPLCH
uniref:Sushi domain-containing protein n=1 Tax=Scleropages formosus TaxID=113540 RepID=A0A8C9R0W9_SCLFO